MKKCPFCGAELNDDSLFCTECGKQLPKDNQCPHCGASVNDGDAFCTKCGKPLGELASLPNTNLKEPDGGLRKYLPYIIGCVLILGLIGYCYSNYYLDNNKDIQMTDSITVDNRENDAEQEIQAKKAFLEKFYKEKLGKDQEDLYAYIKKNVTANGLKILKEQYDYDCEGECLAVWLFDFEGGDLGDFKSVKITPQDKNKFLVESKYEYGVYSVVLTVVKEGENYKIDEFECMHQEAN